MAGALTKTVYLGSFPVGRMKQIFSGKEKTVLKPASLGEVSSCQIKDSAVRSLGASQTPASVYI
jgi:hypothetical protein